MLQKFLLIGVGGSGGKTLRYTWRELDRRLQATGWTEGVPEAWRFLHIDVPENADVIEGDVPAKLGASASYLGLAAAPHKYKYYDDDLVDRHELLPAIAGWRPDPDLEYTSPYKGAGQRRVVGRVITLTRLGAISRALDAQVSELANADVEEQLQRLGRHLDSDLEVNADPATVVVISSLGGGAGSGAVLDIIELLRTRATEQAQWLDNTLMTVLYAADVFSHLSPDKRDGVEPNSLAALSELLAAFEHQGPVAELEDRLLDPGGGTVPIRGRRTGLYNFVIGAKNESVEFLSSLAVFQSVGKALAAFMVDDAVRHQFQTYLQTNWSGAPIKHEFRITSERGQIHPASSFGYANVSLGRSLFAQYASERLAKRALERLLRGHREDLPVGVLRRDETLVTERADAVGELFFEATGLWELSTDHNQVLDEFRDIAEKIKALENVLTKVKGKLNARRSTKMTPKDWLDSFTSTFNDEAREHESTERAERTRRAIEWAGPIQTRVLNAVAQYAGAYGIPVTVTLLERLEQQVRDSADELDYDGQKFNREETSLLGHAQQLFLTIRDKMVTSGHASFSKAAQDRRDALQRRTEAELYGFTASVLRDLNTGFLPQVRAAMRRAEGALAKSETGEYKGLVEQWSVKAVPSHLKAAPNEILLEKEAGFPHHLDELLKATLEIEGARDAESAAIRELISGLWPSSLEAAGQPGTQQLVEQSAQWRPKVSDARDLSSGSGTAAFEIELDPETLLAAATRWVRERRGPVSQQVHGTFREWLDPGQDDASDRADRFADAVAQALNNAAPLISINPNTYRAVHSDDPPTPAYVISEIPIGPEHRAFERVQDALLKVGVQPSVVDELFNANASGSEVEISSFIGRSVHPIVFDSLMGPIQRDWQSRRDVSGRSQFWEFRRSRSLSAFVPLSPSRQRALVRGWMTADVLGQVPVLNGSWSATPLKVWTPRGWKEFPRYLLGADVDEHSLVLAGLMESLPLALLTFASGGHEELDAYLRLLDLGTPGDGSTEGYLVANGELASWVRAGESAAHDPSFEAAPTPEAEFAGTSSTTADERAELMTATLRNLASDYQQTADQRITPETTLTVGRDWEIRTLVLNAAAELIAAITGLPAQPGPPARYRRRNS